MRAAVVDEVELDVAAAPDLLPAPLVLAPGEVAAGARRSARYASRNAAGSARESPSAASRSPRRPSKKIPPTPRCSPRCGRKKYASAARFHSAWRPGRCRSHTSRSARWNAAQSSSKR